MKECIHPKRLMGTDSGCCQISQVVLCFRYGLESMKYWSATLLHVHLSTCWSVPSTHNIQSLAGLDVKHQ